MYPHYVPINTKGSAFALGIFNTKKEAQECYIEFLTSHKNFKRWFRKVKKDLKKECNIILKDKTDFKNSFFDIDDDYTPFWRERYIYCEIRYLKDDSDVTLMLTQIGYWAGRINVAGKEDAYHYSAISALLIGLGCGDMHESYEPDLKKLAKKYPLF
uniref:Uncharacterized protein n=1 Tax=Marseillevirus LCMAC102 TaxID=2506603 RepID=A0A481YTK3_9VIRU|nr:MAG: hypothetical protein LCMAC102_00520 [Marseillevirus LCMAC102]